MTLHDFESGQIMATRHYEQQTPPAVRVIELAQVEAWIADGLLWEPGAEKASARLGRLELTAKGRVAIGIGEPVRQREMF